MPTLHWTGKEHVVNHHHQVPYRTLRPVYGFDAEAGRTDDPVRSGNRIIHGDNLEALKALLPEYEGRIKCIYIDPPYNTGNEGWVYNDNVTDPKIEKWLGEVVGKEGEDLSRHDKWLCMMYPRLRMLRELLSEDGAIFISIDDNEQAHLKLICDEIFGIRNFITDLIWRSADSSNNDSKRFSVDYNHTLVYGKTDWYPHRLARTAENNSHYKNPDNDPRGPWFSGNVSSPNPRENLMYDIVSPSGNVIRSPKNGWRWKKERVDKMIREKVIVFNDDESRIVRKTFLKDQRGIVPSNIWWDIEDTGHNRNAKYELMKVFNELKTSKIFKTPKPTKFIEKILKIGTDQDSIILDSFAGSGTTAHAVLNLNRADGGNRKFILIEMEDYADSITAERVKRVMQGYGKDNKAVPGTGGNFDYYQLGPALFDTEGQLNPDATLDDVRRYVWFTETRLPYPTAPAAHPDHLGDAHHVAYYLCYDPAAETVLDRTFLESITAPADHFVIYADRTTLAPERLRELHLTFKKLPRDLTRL